MENSQLGKTISFAEFERIPVWERTDLSESAGHVLFIILMTYLLNLSFLVVAEFKVLIVLVHQL